MLHISDDIKVPLAEVEITAVRAQGAGGQNVNKVSSAVHLRFDIQAASLPEAVKERLLTRKDRRISKEGVLIIKAQQFRSQEKNRQDALDRLVGILQVALVQPKKRKPTRPSRASRKRRLDEKVQRGRIKTMRGKVDPQSN